MQSVTVIGGSPCPACGGRYKFRTPDNVALCISCYTPATNGFYLFRGIGIRRDAHGFEIISTERLSPYLSYLSGRHAIA